MHNQSNISSTITNEKAQLTVYWDSLDTDSAVLFLHLEKLLSDSSQFLIDLPNDEFDKLKQRLSQYYLHKPSSLAQQSQWHWQNLLHGNIHFNDRKRLAFAIENLSKDRLNRIIDNEVFANNARRLTIFSDSAERIQQFRQNKQHIKGVNYIPSAKQFHEQAGL